MTIPRTSIGSPFALVVSNSAPKLAYLTDYDPETDMYRGHRMNAHWSVPDWRGLYKTAMWIDRANVIAAWVNTPSTNAIKRRAEAFNKRQRIASK